MPAKSLKPWQVEIPAEIARMGMKRADKLQISFSNYVAQIIYFESSDPAPREDTYQPVYFMSDRTEKAYKQALKDSREGKTKSFSNVESLMKYIQGDKNSE